MPQGRPWDYDEEVAAPRAGRQAAPWDQDEEAVNFPGKEASFSQGKPESAWHSAWESVRQSIFGSPEREELKDTGIGLNPTTADMANYAAVVGSMGGTAAVGSALGGVRGPLGAAAKWVGAHPRTVAAATGALPGALEGDVSTSAKGAAIGAVLGAGGKSATDIMRTAKDLMAAGKSAEARALIEAVRRMGAAEAPVAAAAVEKAVVPAVARVLDKGRAAAGAHKALMDFAKGIAEENPKVGQKIWMLLDDAGAPVKMLTPDQAGAAARKGLKTTWVKNLWGSAASTFSE